VDRCDVWIELNSMKKMRKIMETATRRSESRRTVHLATSESCPRRGDKSPEESLESGNTRVEGGVDGVLLYISLTPGVHLLMVSPGGVYRTSKELEVGCATTTTLYTEVDTGDRLPDYLPSCLMVCRALRDPLSGCVAVHPLLCWIIYEW